MEVVFLKQWMEGAAPKQVVAPADLGRTEETMGRLEPLGLVATAALLLVQGSEAEAAAVAAGIMAGAVVEAITI
jgi:hypothetical protein